MAIRQRCFGKQLNPLCKFCFLATKLLPIVLKRLTSSLVFDPDISHLSTSHPVIYHFCCAALFPMIDPRKAKRNTCSGYTR